MSKIEANKLELSPIEYDFDRMLQKTLAVINFRIDEKQQKFTLEKDDSIPQFVIGDDQRLAQVILNLLSNAVKFTPELGEISLTVSLQNEDNGNYELRIEVADTGIGISPKQQKKLFDMFEQVESGRSREYGGTGLGLAISKRIVELMGGDIWVESESGKGTRFIFNVFVQRGKQDTNAASRSETDGRSPEEYHAKSGEFSGQKLLLVEDVDINREILIALLTDTGILIDCAENGQEALDKFEAAPDKYDIVFMDVQMPKMDGLEATRRIRAMQVERERKLPIIAMTANVFQSDIDECLGAGMDCHLGKPLDMMEVTEKLREFMVK
jgi:CheY-like chemotaxis protein/two-component sensor histidine kinase